ncbi:MAG: hypothetical protein RLZZ44_1805 [Bacteroidota bacterium]|jgi:hypothetical protein
MTKPNKFVYLQHIDWDWLPQRPHFLALEFNRLSELGEKEFYYIAAIRKKYLRENSLLEIELVPKALRGSPYWDSYFMRSISQNRLLKDLKKIENLHSSHLYITHPRFFQGLKSLNCLKLTYDCMDDAVAMAGKNHKYVLKLEKELCKRADNIIVTSKSLQELIYERHGRESTIVKNGIALNSIREFASKRTLKSTNTEKKRAIYFGVIGHWIDQEKLLAFDRQNGWDLELYGPLEIKLHKNLEKYYKGTVSQKDLYSMVSGADLALLPFKKNEFTETIDPVKMYEYVGLSLPILATDLTVLQHFRGLFVPWINSVDLSELIQLTELIYPSSNSRRSDILNECSWRQRANQILLTKNFL